jgi:phosphate acetyltransferase
MNFTPAPSTDIHNLTFDELRLGQQARASRTLTLDDIKAFALLSGDLNPPQDDSEYTESTRFQGVIAHGMWAGALIAGLLGTEFPGPGTVYLEQTLKFRRPVRVGDTLTVTLEVLQKIDATRDVRLQCTVINQSAEIVVSGEALVRAPAHKVSRPRAHLPTLMLFEPEAQLRDWMASLAGHPPVRCGVVHPCDESSLRGALDSRDAGLIEPVIIAPRARVQTLAESFGLSLANVEIIDTPHSHASAARAASMAGARQVAMLMKGSLHTDELMEAVLAEPALRTARRMSHVFRFEIPTYDRPLLVTDAAINISPDLTTKADIVRNAIDLAHALGIAMPRVALLSAVETVTPRIASTLDAAALCKMADRGQIQGAVLDGPLAFDNAISSAAARIKGIDSPVAGQADILLVPDLEAGNMLAKQLEYLAGAASCGVVLGAQVPIVLTSRADPPISRVASAALAGVMRRAIRPGEPAR